MGNTVAFFRMSQCTMALNSFCTGMHEDHEIADSEGKVAWCIRIKPSGVLWYPQNGKDCYGIGLSVSSEIMEEKGKKTKEASNFCFKKGASGPFFHSKETFYRYVQACTSAKCPETTQAASGPHHRLALLRQRIAGTVGLQ